MNTGYSRITLINECHNTKQENAQIRALKQEVRAVCNTGLNEAEKS
jgi:hypothetical protein